MSATEAAADSAPVHIVHVFSTFDAGGPQVRTADLIRRLPGSYEHSILAMDGRYGCRERTPEERVRKWLHLEKLGPGRFMPGRLARYLLAQKPDVVATYNWGAIESVLGCQRAGFRAVIHHEEGFGPEEQQRQKLRRVLARRWILRKTHALVVPSIQLENVATEIWKIAAPRVHMIPNGIDIERFESDAQGSSRAAAKAEFSIPPENCVIGSVGHLRPEKNYARLIDAFAALFKAKDSPAQAHDSRAGHAKLQLLLVGDGIERAALTEQVRKHGLTEHVHFAGMMTDTRPAYRAMDIFALSSDTEQMPISLLEAMATGRAVAATAVGDIRAMLAAQNRRYVVEPEGLSAALAALVSDGELRQRLAQANRAHCASEYPMQRCVSNYRSLYESARDKHKI